MDNQNLDRISYALGLSMGNNFRSSGIKTLDIKDFADGVAAVEEVAVNYGLFIQNIVDFLIISLSIFIALRYAVKLKKKEEEPAPAPEPAPTKEETLLTEIRDLLKQQNSQARSGK